MARYILIAGLACAALALPARAEDDDLTALSLEDLLQLTVTTRSALSERESPGIVSVVTREEIRDSGARDLDDVLRLVPGFDFGVDYYGTVGMAFRGVWGIEGKVLLLMDGVPLNELYYNSVLIGNRVAMDQIERIEVIRGPGSVVYGGAAETAVINIVTESGAQTNGVRATAQYGQLQHSYGRETASVSYGQRFGKTTDDPEVSVKLYAAQAQRSDRDRVYPDGSIASNVNAYRQTPLEANVALTWKGFSARLLVDHNRQNFLDSTGTALNRPSTERFDNTFAEVKYEWKPAPWLTITPQYDLAFADSYDNFDFNATTVSGAPAATDVNSDIRMRRHRASLTAQATPMKGLDLLAGGEYSQDHAGSASGMLTPNPQSPSVQSDHLDFQALAGFGQALWKTPVGTLTAGVRAEWQSATGSAVVPRFAYTKAFENLHFKLLYSRAFRNPSTGNINDAAYTGVRIERERTRALEAEVGYRFTPHHQLTLNAFQTTIFGPIAYVGATNSYQNYLQTGSRGLEAEYRANGWWGSARVNYSFYTTDGINQVPLYAVAQDPSQLAGFSPHKLTLIGTLKLTSRVHLSPSLVLLGKRYTFTGTDGSGTLSTTPVDPTLLANLFLSVADVGVRGLEIGAGVYNLLGKSYAYPTPYDFGRNPMAAQSREFLVRLAYRYGL